MSILDDDTLIGHKLDQRYVIHELIARGGMASVFRATDERLERVVAVKIMHPDNAAVTSAAEFSQEAKLAARLNHRGIVSVFDQGTDGSLTYLVMEYVPGRTLRDVIRDEAPMPPRRALAYLEPVLIALDAAHSAGLIHRDMKPENVLIGTSGEVKVADFGLARASTVDHRTSSVLIGTVSYLAPEVITHQGVDARADVYACGAVLFEMLTGQKPHRADSPIAVAHKHVSTDVVAPSTLVAGIPTYVDALTLRALARDRAQRSPDARTFLHQLRLVQRALADGLVDDPELTRDLLPGSGPTPANVPILPPLGADREATAPVDVVAPPSDLDATTLVGAASTSEPTRTWETPPHLPPPSTPPTPVKARRSRRGPLLLMVAIAALALAGVMGWWAAFGRWDQTPDLVNLTVNEAAAVAEKSGFTVAYTPEAYSETVAKGAVISTDPSPGARILPESTITLTVSKGQERYAIPNIRGKTIDEASTVLGSLHLQVGNITHEYHDTVAAGGVIRSSSHKVDQKVKRDTAVDLVVSKGPAPVDLVNYTGKKAADAVKELTALGLEPTTKHEYHDTVATGIVISQSPKPGTVHRGDTVTLVVSRGPELFAVPDLDGMTAKEATAALSRVNLVANPSFNPFANRDRATVKYQSPTPGTKVKRGTSVTIFLS